MSKSIAIVVSKFSGGGAEKSMSILHSELLQRGVNSTLLSLKESNEIAEFESYNMIGLGREKSAGFFSSLCSYLKFYHFILKNRPPILLLNCDLPELFGTLVLIATRGIRAIVVEHANPSWPTRKLLGRIVRKMLIWRQSSFVAVSDHITSPFGNHGYHKVIPNFLGDFEESADHDSADSIERLIYIGRLTSIYKSPKSLLSIAKETGIPVIFIGEGELEAELVAESQRDNLPVTFRGWIENPWSEFASGDLLIVPSRSEGDGLVVVESIVRGIPLLLRDIPDFRRFGLEEFQYCLEDENFSEAISNFKQNLQCLKPSKAAKEKLLEARNTSRLIENWVSLFDEIWFGSCSSPKSQ